MKIVIVASTSDFINAFLIDFIFSLSKNHEILIITDKNIQKFKSNKKINQKNIMFDRKINILNDIKCLFKFYFYIINFSPRAVISFTPKAGLISAITSFLSFTKIRLHYFTGQIWAKQNKRIDKLLMLLDKLISILSTNILCDSFSQKNFLVKNNIVNISKIDVIHNGSIKGVNLNFFNYKPLIRKKIRDILSLSNEDKILLIVSRLNKDKGILNLPSIINPVFKKFNNLFVLIIGKDEENLNYFLSSKLKIRNRIKFLKYTKNISHYLIASDLLLITSLREGFGNIALEASACKLPIVSNNIYGLDDVVIDNYNGLKYNDNQQATKNIIKYLSNKKLREKNGINGRKLAIANYDSKLVIKKFTEYIDKLNV